MELSPLPHKAPFFVAVEVEPTPQAVSLDEDKILPMETMQDSVVEGLQQPNLQE